MGIGLHEDVPPERLRDEGHLQVAVIALVVVDDVTLDAVRVVHQGQRLQQLVQERLPARRHPGRGCFRWGRAGLKEGRTMECR